MSQSCCYRVWDGSHQKFRRSVLILAFIDLLLVTGIIIYVGISLVELEEPLDPSNPDMSINGENSNEANSSRTDCGFDDDDCIASDPSHNPNVNKTSRIFPTTPYFKVVGVRIAKSIQLIIYTCQWAMTIVLIRGLLRTDTLSMRTWLIVTEIITTVVLLVLVLYLFGSIKTDTVIIICIYLIYQFIMIRTVSRFIRRTEIELTQFGSIVEF